VPPTEADAWAVRLDELKDDVEAVLEEEKEEKALNTADRDLRKSENLIIYEDEIKSRPKRTWFENEKDKKSAQDKGRAELNGEVVLKKKLTTKKLSNKEKKKLDLRDERKDTRMWKKGKKDVEAVKGPGKKGGGKPMKTNGAKKTKGK
jgi:ATP-dependent RNA helicase DDX27